METKNLQLLNMVNDVNLNLFLLLIFYESTPLLRSFTTSCYVKYQSHVHLHVESKRNIGNPIVGFSRIQQSDFIQQKH